MNIGHRASVMLSFAILPVAAAVPILVARKYLGVSAESSPWVYFSLRDILLASLIHVPLLVAAAAGVARAFLIRRDYLFRYSAPGHFIVGAAIYIASSLATLAGLYFLTKWTQLSFVVEMRNLSRAFIPWPLVLWVILGGLWGVGTAIVARDKAPTNQALH